MTITQSGSPNTGMITVTNEPAVTLSAIAAAVSGCTSLGFSAYHMDRDIEFINSSFSMTDEMLLCTFDVTSGYSNDPADRPFWRLSEDSDLTFSRSLVGWALNATGVSFTPGLGNSNPLYDSPGQVTATDSIFHMGNFSTWNAGAFFTMRPVNTPKANYILSNNQFVGGNPTRGWGVINGGGSSQSVDNKAIGLATANAPFETNTGNFAKDGDIFVQFNTSQTLSQQIIDNPRGGPFNVASIQVLLRQVGTGEALVVDSEIPRTYQNFNPIGSSQRAANLYWAYRHNATVTDGDDDLPEENVRLDIVPTTISGDSVQTTKFSDASGEFTETFVYHSLDYLLDTPTPTEVNTQYGPFRLRYWKYEFITQDRSGDPYDEKKTQETPRLLRDLSLLSTTAPSDTRELTTLGEVRDNWKLETGSDLGLIDVTAGGGSVDIGAYTLAFDDSATNSLTRSGALITLKADSLAADSKYTNLVVNTVFSIPSGVTLTCGLSIASGANIAYASDTQAANGATNLQGGTLTLNSVSDTSLAGSFQSGAVNVSGASSGALNLTGVTDLSAAITIDNSGAGDIVVRIFPNQTAPTLNNTGSGSLTIENSIPVTWANIVDGSKYQIYDLDLGVELAIGTTSGGTGINESIPSTSLDNSIRIRVAKDGGPGNAKLWKEVIRIADFDGFVIDEDQEDDTTYNANGINGSTITFVSWSDANLRWEATGLAGDFTLTFQDWYAYNVFWQTTDEGVRRGQQMTGPIQTEYRFLNGSKLFNTSLTVPIYLDGAAPKDEAGANYIPYFPCEAGVTAGASVIFANSGYNPQLVQDVEAIKVNTDRVDGLIEDVGGDRYTAKALEEAPGTSGTVDANMVSVDGTAVTGPDDLKADTSNLALEASVQARPTNPVLTTDPRLDNLDAQVSTRSIFNATTDDVNTNTASREASKADVSNLDVAVSTRLPTSGYTAPDNTGIADAKAAAEAVDGRLPATPADEATLNLVGVTTTDTNGKVSNMPLLDETLYNKNETTNEQIQTTVSRNPIP